MGKRDARRPGVVQAAAPPLADARSNRGYRVFTTMSSHCSRAGAYTVGDADIRGLGGLAAGERPGVEGGRPGGIGVTHEMGSTATAMRPVLFARHARA